MRTIEDLHPSIQYLEGVFDALAAMVPIKIDTDEISNLFHDTLKDIEGDLLAIWSNRETMHMDEIESLRDKISELQIRLEKKERKE